MKRILCLLTALLLLLTLAACVPYADLPVNTGPCSVMVDGQLFHTYYEKADVDPDAIQPAGTITHASCNITAVPSENDTSNWEACVSQPYAWVDGDLILFYENRWNICYRTDEVGGSYRIMVNGILYYTFSKPAPSPSDEQIAGTIETCTEGLWVDPTEDNQTNHEDFVGQPYAFVGGELVLFYNDQWNTCKPFAELESSETQPTEAPTTEPTTEPTTAPTKPPEPETPWLTAASENLTYEEYFSQTRIFTHNANLYVNRWKINEDGSIGTILSDYNPDHGYALVLDDEGFLIVSFANDEKLPAWISGHRTGSGLKWNSRNDPLEILWKVPGSETLTDIDRYITDGRYAYCIRNQSEIFRLDLLIGDTETLYTVESIPVGNRDCLCLHDQNVLVFLSQAGDTIAINRLYLPTMTLDVLYDGINADAFLCNFSLSYEDTDTLIWRIFDSAFIPRVTDILSDPDSEYQDYVVAPDRIWGADDLSVIASHQDFITLVQMIEMHEEIPSLLSCCLDIPSGTYEEAPYYWTPGLNES